VLVAGCGVFGGTDTPQEEPQQCEPTRDYFAHTVWASFMSTTCFKCHSPDGVAAARNARLILQPPAYPGFLDSNLATVGEVAKTEYEGVSVLLRKPLGEMAHGGGVVLTADSPQYEALKQLIDRLKNGDPCPGEPAKVSLDGVQQLDPSQTFRKAALTLGGRLPTKDELGQISAGGEAALDAALDKLVEEDAFYERLKEGFNDFLLTDKYQWMGRGWPLAIYQLNGTDYPGANTVRQKWESTGHGDYTTDQWMAANDAIGREPLNLIAHVVKENRPFSEILTADYALVNDASAEIYGVTSGSGLREAKVTNSRGQVIPHAGILSTPAFLNRWPTTPTNRSRGRARVLLKNFLATDILKLADRPVDVALVTQVDNPTMNAEQCTVCHRIIDPIAGGFRGWDESDYEKFTADAAWHQDMLHPGFGTGQLPSSEYGAAIQWLAREMAADPRFDRAAMQMAFRLVTGRELLAYPGGNETSFEADLHAWEAQDQFLRESIEKYVAKNRNFKVLVKAVVESPYFRATYTPGISGERLIEVAALGTSRLLSPEMLNRKIVATTGYHWRKMWDWDKPPQDWMLDNGILSLYGGIDSDAITERIASLSGVMQGVALRMANELSCNVVSNDFNKAQESRSLFPLVRQIDVPESAGYPVEGSIKEIKRNIRLLHERILGESLAEDDPEIEATYQLFLETWREGTAMDGPATKSMPWNCGLSLDDGKALPDSIRRDSNYVIRSWMAVVTYLLLDYRFLHE
jgi:hypothetical protein